MESWKAWKGFLNITENKKASIGSILNVFDIGEPFYDRSLFIIYHVIILIPVWKVTPVKMTAPLPKARPVILRTGLPYMIPHYAGVRGQFSARQRASCTLPLLRLSLVGRSLTDRYWNNNGPA